MRLATKTAAEHDDHHQAHHRRPPPASAWRSGGGVGPGLGHTRGGARRSSHGTGRARVAPAVGGRPRHRRTTGRGHGCARRHRGRPPRRRGGVEAGARRPARAGAGRRPRGAGPGGCAVRRRRGGCARRPLARRAAAGLPGVGRRRRPWFALDACPRPCRRALLDPDPLVVEAACWALGERRPTGSVGGLLGWSPRPTPTPAAGRPRWPRSARWATPPACRRCCGALDDKVDRAPPGRGGPGRLRRPRGRRGPPAVPGRPRLAGPPGGGGAAWRVERSAGSALGGGEHRTEPLEGLDAAGRRPAPRTRAGRRPGARGPRCRRPAAGSCPAGAPRRRPGGSPRR